MNSSTDDEFERPEAVLAALVRMGLADRGEHPVFAPLAGGVSSDIWRVDLARGPVCVKRALPRLRVSAEWRVPVERNAYEVAWMRHAGRIVPDAVPEILGEDETGRLFAMAYLDPDRYPTWKARLLAGRVDPGVADAVGERIGRIHQASAGSSELAARFDTGALFHAIRLEPYLLATARAHPALAPALEDIARVTGAERHTLVHGDVSPKNLLLGPKGPVFLDAECAWYGDPAFDVAFCLNHLLLKCLPARRATGSLLDAFDALWRAYRRHVSWEPAARLEERTARLLPGLFLARVDGKSPVEYLDEEVDRARVRRVAAALVEHPPSRLAQVRDAWLGELQS